MSCSVSSLHIAKYVYDRCKEQNIPINDTKLQKLVYIAYGIYAIQHSGVLCDETPKLFPYGPVFPKVLKYSQKGKIDSIGAINLSGSIEELLDSVVSDYGSFPAGQLSNWSHREGSAWYNTKELISDKWSTEIPLPLIREEFFNFMNRGGKSE